MIFVFIIWLQPEAYNPSICFCCSRFWGRIKGYLLPLFVNYSQNPAQPPFRELISWRDTCLGPEGVPWVEVPDSPSATKNAYLLCLSRRYIIHFQYSVSEFAILELTKSREWVLSTLVGQKRPFLLLFRDYWTRSCVRICRFGGHE